MVNDDREYKSKKGKINLNSSENEKINVYILNCTCALSRRTTLEVSQNRSYESTKAALLRIFFERGAPRVLVSDQEASFKAVAKDFSKIQEHKDAVKWLGGWRESEEKKCLEKALSIKIICDRGKVLFTKWILLIAKHFFVFFVFFVLFVFFLSITSFRSFCFFFSLLGPPVI